MIFFLPFPALAQDFDPRRLSDDDTRLLQAALAHDGAYVGRIDGDWGRRSAAALAAAAGPRPSETAVLRTMRGFLEDVERSGWEAWNPQGTSALVPMRLLRPEEGPDFFELASPDRGLVLRFIFRPPGATGDMHRWLESEHAGPKPFYRADTAEAFVSKGRLASGRTVYLRTMLLRGVHETVLVQWEPRQSARGRVVVASLSNGYVPPLRLSEGGYLAAMMRRPAPPPPPAPARVTSDRPPEPVGTGTGFYINGTDVVTAAHVVERCAVLTLGDGSAALLVASDTQTDLAVLRTVRPSETWIELAPSEAALGAPVMALGFPYANLFRQGISATRGNVSAQRGLDGEPHVVMISAPVQPGNSGGPLLDGRGRAIGVVSHRVSDFYTLDRTGSLPQNMNGATRLTTLRAFLDDAGVTLPPPATAVRDIAAGLPPALEAAVIPVVCRGG